MKSQPALRELHGQEEQGCETQQHEQSGADFESPIRLHDHPLQVLRAVAALLLKKRRGQNQVQQQHEHRRSDHGSRRCESDASAAVGSAW